MVSGIFLNEGILESLGTWLRPISFCGIPKDANAKIWKPKPGSLGLNPTRLELGANPYALKLYAEA